MPRLKARLNKIRIVAIVVVTIFVLGLIYVITDEFNRKYIFNPIGYRDAGSAFSVVVGQPRNTALNTLKNNDTLSLYESRPGNHCLTRRYGQEMDLDIFEDRSWRRGSICVASAGGVVVEVVWYYNFLAP
jgi:hypothetical protein